MQENMIKSLDIQVKDLDLVRSFCADWPNIWPVRGGSSSIPDSNHRPEPMIRSLAYSGEGWFRHTDNVLKEMYKYFVWSHWIDTTIHTQWQGFHLRTNCEDSRPVKTVCTQMWLLGYSQYYIASFISDPFPGITQIFSRILLTNSSLIHHNKRIFIGISRVHQSPFIVSSL